MAKLNKENAKKVDAASSGFDPIPGGVYHARLVNVDSSKAGAAGPYWSWEYKIAGGEYDGRRLWNNTTLAEGKQFGLKQTFEAFGVPTTTDTDDLCGKLVKLQVGVRVIQQGPRQGEEVRAPRQPLLQAVGPGARIFSLIDLQRKWGDGTTRPAGYVARMGNGVPRPRVEPACRTERPEAPGGLVEEVADRPDDRRRGRRSVQG
jgi:hypothetical protein